MEAADILTSRDDAIVAFKQATGRSHPARRRHRRRSPPLRVTGTAVAPPPIPPTGFTDQAAPLGDLGSALVGRTVLSWLPDHGWRRGTVAPRGAFSHVVAYNRQTSAPRGTAYTLLNAASYGSRWVLLSPAPASGVARRARARARPGPLDPGPICRPPTLNLSLVGGSSQLPARGQDSESMDIRIECSAAAFAEDSSFTPCGV